MPPRKPTRTPQENFFERGRQLLQDAENSTNPELAKLRAKAAKRYFDVDLRGGARISTNVAVAIDMPILVLLVGFCIYAAVKLSGAVFGLVLVACIAFAIIISVLLLALCGIMTDTLVAKVLLGIFDKVIAKFGKPKSGGN